MPGGTAERNDRGEPGQNWLLRDGIPTVQHMYIPIVLSHYKREFILIQSTNTSMDELNRIFVTAMELIPNVLNGS